MSSDVLAKRLVRDASVLMLPGTMFCPPGPEGARHMRIAFANVDVDGIAELFNRLARIAAL
jgi:aspartate/methionine/tyrosine aminotransferase